MGIVTRALNVVKGTVMAIADMAMGFDSRTKLDLTAIVMLLCAIGLVLYLAPLVILFVLAFTAYNIVQPMIGETEDEALDKYVVHNSGDR